jgi:hypothetical protein
MRIAMPEFVRRLPLDHPELAVQEFAQILGQVRDLPPGAAAALEAAATEAIEWALRERVVLLAVVTPSGAAPALLSGVVLEVPTAWDAESADRLRDSMSNVGGPDVRENLTIDTELGPVVIVQRVPGREQLRARRPLAVQLQAFVPQPGTGRMLVLTLACPSIDGWDVHQLLFGEMVASVGPDHEVAPDAPNGSDEESFEHHTYRLG